MTTIIKYVVNTPNKLLRSLYGMQNHQAETTQIAHDYHPAESLHLTPRDQLFIDFRRMYTLQSEKSIHLCILYFVSIAGMHFKDMLTFLFTKDNENKEKKSTQLNNIERQLSEVLRGKPSVKDIANIKIELQDLEGTYLLQLIPPLRNNWDVLCERYARSDHFEWNTALFPNNFILFSALHDFLKKDVLCEQPIEVNDEEQQNRYLNDLSDKISTQLEENMQEKNERFHSQLTQAITQNVGEKLLQLQQLVQPLQQMQMDLKNTLSEIAHSEVQGINVQQNREMMEKFNGMSRKIENLQTEIKKVQPNIHSQQLSEITSQLEELKNILPKKADNGIQQSIDTSALENKIQTILQKSDKFLFVAAGTGVMSTAVTLGDKATNSSNQKTNPKSILKKSNT